jgi:hypothetical protein
MKKEDKQQTVVTEEKRELKVRELDKVSGGYGYGGYGGGYGGWGGGYSGWGGGYSSAALCTDDGMGPWSGSSWA